MKTSLNFEFESGTYKNMPVVKNHYLPRIMGMEQRHLKTELTRETKIKEWEQLKLDIESDLFSIGKLHNQETLDFCQNRLFPLIDNRIKKIKSDSSPQYNNEEKLNQKQIALIHAYEGKPITRESGKEIAKKYGYYSKTSGHKLYQLFNKYYNPTDRKGGEDSKRKNQAKIRLIESVIPYLSIANQERADREKENLINITNTKYK